MAKGLSKTTTHYCSRCGQRYSTPQEAKYCFNTGLPNKLSPGTTFRRGDEYFSIHFLDGKPRAKTHERKYVVGTYPDPTGSSYGIIEATASFDGQRLHSIQREHSRGGMFNWGPSEATRLGDSELNALLEDPPFREFHEKATSFGKRSRIRARSN